MSNYKIFDKVVIRSPLLPLLKDISILSEEDLKFYIQNETFQEALYVASPDLYKQGKDLLNGNLKEGKDKDKVTLSILKYIARSGTRCTPFGMFAGVGMGTIGEKTEIIKDELKTQKKRVRLDMYYLSELIEYLISKKNIEKQLKFYPNTSLYTLSGQIRYVEYVQSKGEKRTHRITSVEDSTYIQKVLNRALKGALLEDLAKELQDDEIRFEEALGFIEELVSSQILVSELEPTVTGEQFFTILKSKIGSLNNVDEELAFLNQIETIFSKINNAKIGTGKEYFIKLSEKLKIPEKKIPKKYLHQTDLCSHYKKATFDKVIFDNVMEAFEVLTIISQASPPETVLNNFKKEFIERFEEEEVPLSFVFDTELGLGYTSSHASMQTDNTPLVDDLRLPEESTENTFKMPPFQNILFLKYKEAIKKGNYTIKFTKKDFEKYGLEANWNNLSDTLSAMATIYNDTDTQKIHLGLIAGSSAANLLGRFGDLSEELYSYIKEITAKEAALNENKILAEIVHLPQSRVGNVIIRPVIREFEIPYLAQSAVDKEHQLPISDLYLSYKRGQIILRSKRLNKEIIPMLTNAHNYAMDALPIYHFLSDLSKQNKRPGVFFSWGFMANQFGFLPRVEYKNIILSRAQWNFSKEDIKDMVELKGQNLLDAITKLREKWGMPEKVVLSEGDNELYIDLTSELYIRMLFNAIGKKPSFQLIEFLDSPERAIIKDEKGNSYTNQIVFSFYKNKE
jgi:hypothetical protein